ncbi:MAG: two-component regulator propeller domain-containing protein [Bacteroidota bacterium]|nr:two-component regulator propeller domain-containing protein [Bacteroidota bacterium]
MKKFRALYGAFLLMGILTGIVPVKAQVFKFQKFGLDKGICHPFVYSINQDKNGFIWAATGVGLCRFDGFNFTHNINKRDSLPEAVANISYKDKDDNLWVGHNDGTIVFYDGRKFKVLKPAENQNNSITDIIADENRNILAATQSSGIIIIDKDFKRTQLDKPFQGAMIYALNLTSGNELLVGTDEGLKVYSYSANASGIKFIANISGFPPSKVNKIVKRGKTNSFWVGTEDAGLYKVTATGKGKYIVENFGSTLHIEKENVQSVFEDKQSNLWISTKEKGLFKVVQKKGQLIKDLVNFNSTNGLGQDYIKDAFMDREGNIWVATYGNGIANFLNESFVYYNYKDQFKDNNVLAVCYDKDGYWLGGKNGLLRIKTGLEKSTEMFGASAGIPADNITSLYLDSKGTLWIGTDKSGVYQIKTGSKRAVKFFRNENSLANSVNHINGYGNSIYVGTKNGVYQFNVVTGQQQHFSTSEGLPYNDINHIFIDSKGIPWIATRSSSVFSLNPSIPPYTLKSGADLEFTSLAQDAEGNMWAGTSGNGIFKFMKDTFYNFTTREGLKSDYCYAITADMSGNIWIGHRLGMSRINSKTRKIRTFGAEAISGDINPNAISKNAEGNILFGTTDGLIVYESSKDKKATVLPLANILSVTINDSVYDISKKIVLPYSHYRVKFEFIGLNYSNPEQVTYQYKLEGFDTEWSEPSTSRTAPYSRLSDGNYTFMVRACNSDGVYSAPITIQVKIRQPFWKTWWFIIFAIVALVAFVYFIIRFRERKQKAFQEYLERLLEERTREVRSQKEEIELKNRDITDSINYAQRIQASILPSMRKLQHIFTGSFVYYAPRDIVSGDFYWFEIIPNTDRLLVVCADSTGHGVPGAFMSIIGTTLLKDIYSRPGVNNPSDILFHLDNELKATLTQNTDNEKPNDGMDIIVCEINLKTYKTKFASAMRPFIVYQNGEQLCYKGSRSSIGGQVMDNKIFDDVELQLSKGDQIYMFSDGYPDQFGGSLGKKFKMVRLRNMLNDIYQKPMDEQYNFIKSNFEMWKGELEQIDDVLFMGIKI